MIRAYLKDSLYWLHLFCFKLRTFMQETEKLSRGQAVAVFLKVYPWFVVLNLILLTVIGLTCEQSGVPFDWQRALTGAITGAIPGGLICVLFALLGWQSSGASYSLFMGLVWILTFNIFPGLLFALVSGQFGWPSVGLFTGLLGGLLIGLAGGLVGRLSPKLLYVPSVGLIVGLFLWAKVGWDEAVRFAAIYFPIVFTTFAFVFGRPYYWPLHLVQLWRARRSRDWLARFRHSPVHWDETIGVPLPWLTDWLFEIAKTDRKEGLDEVLWVAAERPFQRKDAQRALLKLAVYDLLQFKQVADLRGLSTALDFLPENRKNRNLFPLSLSQARPYLSQIAELATDFLKRPSTVGQHKALLALQAAVNRFAKAMALAPAPTGHELQRVATQWLQFTNTEEAALRARLPFENPFIVGPPLREDEFGQFKGRRDLIVKLEEAIFSQRPSLLLYGRRRTGKTSTLLNLPRLMSSQFVPVFIDCQNARWADSDTMFCYHLARALHDELAKRKLPLHQDDGLAQPQKSEFEAHAFTRLDEFLDELEVHSRRIGKQILLTFDEYERLEEGIRDGKLTRAVLNQIRAIVQHRERLIVLFSGSHRFEELQTVNWSDYLINVRTLHLNFLAREEARELIEHPTLEFALGYEPGVVDRILDLTHGQPYLVQALGSELVNLINSQKRKQATGADLELAIERVLGAADAYFENNWRECGPAEQAVLCALATGEAVGLTTAERQAALQALSRKELVEQRGEQWQYTVELFRRWVLKNQVPAAVAVAERALRIA
ncbi:MAG: AAA family ATPase [Blastocatellia bacterium]